MGLTSFESIGMMFLWEIHKKSSKPPDIGTKLGIPGHPWAVGIVAENAHSPLLQSHLEQD